jgi:hypothetical protein
VAVAVNVSKVPVLAVLSGMGVRTGALFTSLTRTTKDCVVLKLGEPATDRWRAEGGELQYEAMAYPRRKLTVILMGSDRKSVYYIGTMDDKWEPVHSVTLRSGGTTSSLLRALKRF